VTEFSVINCKREELDTYLKKNIRETRNTEHRRKSGKARAYWKESGHCEWTARPTKSGRPETNISFSAPDIQRDGSNTVQHLTIIHRDLGLKCLSFTNTPIIVGCFYVFTLIFHKVV